jgi:hypothetical protein
MINKKKGTYEYVSDVLGRHGNEYLKHLATVYQPTEFTCRWTRKYLEWFGLVTSPATPPHGVRIAQAWSLLN